MSLGLLPGLGLIAGRSLGVRLAATRIPVAGPLGLAAAPALGLAVALAFFRGPGLPVLAGTLLGLTIVSAAGGAWIGWRRIREIAAARRLAQSFAAAQQEAGALAAEVCRLQAEIDVLAAVREIGLVVNADNEFADVLGSALKVVEDLLRAEEVALFLRNRESGAIAPIARRIGGKFQAIPDLDPSRVDATHVAEALDGRRLLRVTDGSRLALTLPLAIEGGVVGVLRTVVELSSTRPEERAAECERALRGIEQHLALAIKAPSLYDRAVRDGLTGLYNKRHLENQLVEFIAIARRTGEPVSLVIADLDHFKKVNDTHGHTAGDQVLREAASVLKGSIRSYDTAFRYGGEEMCVLLPNTAIGEAVKTAERIRKGIEKRAIRIGDDGRKLAVTVSLGVAQFHPRMQGSEDFVNAADRALYKAKEAGRNRTVAAATTAGATAA